MKIIPFEQLAQSDLVVDAIYESTHNGLLSGEPLSKLLPGLGNMGGFRPSGRGEDKNLVVLFSTGRDIAEIMINAGYNTVETVTQFLNAEFTL